MAILLVALAWGWLRLSPQPPVADDRHYVAMAWNLAERGALSLEVPVRVSADSDLAPPAPTGFREPGYPVLLAAVMRLLPASRAAAFCDEPSADGALPADCRAALRLAQLLNLLLILGAAALTAAAVLAIGGSPPAALLALGLLSLSPKVLDYAGFLISESLTLFLAAAAGFLLLAAAMRRPTWSGLVAALAAGLACGALAATKQALLPLVLPAALGLAIALVWRSPVAGGRLGNGLPKVFLRALLRALALVLGWACIVGPWLFWNLSMFGSPLPSDRAREGEVLAYRVELLEMRPAEYGIAWLWWTSNFGDDWARDLFAERHWARFQDHRAEGFTPSSHRRWAGDVAAFEGQGLTPGQAYAAVATDYRDRLVAAWPWNLAISLPVLNRGVWVDNLAIGTVPCLLVLLVMARRWRLGAFYLFALPGLVGLAIHAGLSNNIPRWNLPLAPALAAAGGLVVWRLAVWAFGRFWRPQGKGLET